MDTAVLTAFGVVFKPAPTPPHSAAESQLVALVTCRTQLLEVRTAAQQRLELCTNTALRRLFRQLLRTVGKQITAVETLIENCWPRPPSWPSALSGSMTSLAPGASAR